MAKKCKHLNMREIGMIGYFPGTEDKDCDHGCKVYKCEKCDFTLGAHNPTYGCRGFENFTL